MENERGEREEKGKEKEGGREWEEKGGGAIPRSGYVWELRKFVVLVLFIFLSLFSYFLFPSFYTYSQ